MAEAFASTAPSKNANAAGAELALQMQRFVASDVIWEDLFKEPTKERAATTSTSPASTSRARSSCANPDIATTASMKSVWQRIHGAATGGANC